LLLFAILVLNQMPKKISDTLKLNKKENYIL